MANYEVGVLVHGKRFSDVAVCGVGSGYSMLDDGTGDDG